MRTQFRKRMTRPQLRRHPKVAVQRSVVRLTLATNTKSAVQLIWRSPRQLNAEVVTDFQDHVIRGIRLEFDGVYDLAANGIAGDAGAVTVGIQKVQLDDTGAVVGATAADPSWGTNNDKQADWLFHDSRILWVDRSLIQTSWRTDTQPTSGYIIKTKRRMEDNDALGLTITNQTTAGTGRAFDIFLTASVWYSIG